MNESTILLEREAPSDRIEEAPRSPLSRETGPKRPGTPSRQEWEERLTLLLSRLEGLEQDILEDEFPAGAPSSPLRDCREDLLTRVADLQWLISCSKD